MARSKTALSYVSTLIGLDKVKKDKRAVKPPPTQLIPMIKISQPKRNKERESKRLAQIQRGRKYKRDQAIVDPHTAEKDT